MYNAYQKTKSAIGGAIKKGANFVKKDVNLVGQMGKAFGRAVTGKDIAPVKGSFKKGGKVKATGVYKLHKGEKVVPVKKGTFKGKSNKLGGGGRFAQIAAKAGGGKKGAAIAASVGMKKYGKAKMTKMAAKGKK